MGLHMGLMLPDLLLIHFLLPRATALHFLEYTSLVTSPTLQLVDTETSHYCYLHAL